MIVNHWGSDFTKLYGHIWPETYLVLDTEYTGGNAEKDLICEWGHVMVEDREIIDRKNIVINWYESDIVPESWLTPRLRYCQNNYPGWRITPKVMRQEGIHPTKALEFILKLCETWKSRRLPFVAHNGYHADERMIRGNIEGFLGKSFGFGENGLIDTGAVYKATLAIDSDDPGIRKRIMRFYPETGDTLESYFRRVVKAYTKGLRWNLKSCLEHFKLDEKFKLDSDKLHGAGYDSWCTYLLFEEFRQWITQNNSGEYCVDSPAALNRMFDEENAKINLKEKTKENNERDFEEQQSQGAPKGFNKRRRRKQRVL